MNFNLTRNDLATKSASHLAALFQQASNAIAFGAVGIGLTLLGMWLFGRQEPKDET